LAAAANKASTSALLLLLDDTLVGHRCSGVDVRKASIDVRNRLSVGNIVFMINIL
jgi:hypothetical protein